MSKFSDVEPDPSVVGRVAQPPFAQLPDPARVFSRRAKRLRTLAPGHDLEAYLTFLADLTEIQVATLDGLPEPQMPAPEAIARAHDHAMPPLDRNGFQPGPAFDATFERLVAGAEKIAMPDEARAALARLKALARPARDVMVHDVLADSAVVETLAEHVFVAAILEVHFARMAQKLDAGKLKKVGDGACPCCGAPPVASVIVGWPGAVGARYCCCSLCSTLWNYVRVLCTICGSSEKISYREIEGGNGQIKAEVCESCNGYGKVLYQQKEPALDPVADDVASLGLDILMRELGFRRGGVNPFLLGY